MIPVVGEVVVAPLRSTIRAIPANIPIGASEGIDHDSVATFDLLSAVPKAVLTVRLGALPAARRHEICAALAALADCWRHDLGVNGLDSEAVDTQISVGDRPVSVTVSRSSAVLIFIGDSLIVDLLDASLDPRVTLG